MEPSTAIAIAVVLFVVLFIPYAVFYIRRGKAQGHTWFTWWPRGQAAWGFAGGSRADADGEMLLVGPRQVLSGKG